MSPRARSANALAPGAGVYTGRVRFEVVSPERRTMGQEVDSWAPIATAPEMWARVEPLTGDERWDAQVELGKSPYRVTVRYRADLTVRHRLVDLRTGLIHDIQSIADVDGLHEELEVMTLVTNTLQEEEEEGGGS